MDMMNVMFTELDIQAPGNMSKANNQSLGIDSVFAQLLLNSLGNEAKQSIESSLGLVNSEDMDMSDLTKILSELSKEDLAMLQIFVQQIIGNSNDEHVSNFFTEQELDIASEMFGSVERFFSQIDQTITALLNGSSGNKGQFTMLNNNSNIPLNFSDKIITNNELFEGNVNKDNSSSETAKVNFNDLFKESDKLNQLVAVLKKILWNSEQKTFQNEALSKQPLNNVNLIPVQVQNRLNQLQNAVDNQQTKQSDETLTSGARLVVGEMDNNNNNQQQMAHSSDSNKQTNVGQQMSSQLDTQNKEEMFTFQSVLNTKEAANSTSASSEMKLSYSSASEFQKQIEELVVNQAKLVKKPNGQQSMIINLHPANLGSLKILVTANQGQITTSITTDSLMTKELLESTVNNLRLALVSTGIHVDRIDVQQQNNMSQAVHQAANAQSSQLHQQKRNADQHDDQQNKKNKNSGRFTVEELEELALDFINENQIDKRFLNFNDSGTVVNYTA